MPEAAQHDRPLAWLRFDLWTLAELVAGVGLAVALATELAEMGALLILLGVAILFVAQYVGTADNRRAAYRRLVIGALLLLIPSCLCCLGIPIYSHATPTAWSHSCRNNIRTIALALHMYHDQWGQFPPAVLTDPNGKPMHSWRVLILPYLEQNQAYDDYDFTQPWDSPRNRQVAAGITWPFEAHCPTDSSNSGNRATYFYVVGPDRLKPGTDVLSLHDITDTPSETILLVESSSMTVDWFEPRDLTVEEALKGINPPQGPGISSHHQEQVSPGRSYAGANVAFADGSGSFLRNGTDRDTLAALLTIDGGEKIDPAVFELPNRKAAMLWLLVLWMVYLAVIIGRHWGLRPWLGRREATIAPPEP